MSPGTHEAFLSIVGMSQTTNLRNGPVSPLPSPQYMVNVNTRAWLILLSLVNQLVLITMSQISKVELNKTY